MTQFIANQNTIKGATSIENLIKEELTRWLSENETVSGHDYEVELEIEGMHNGKQRIAMFNGTLHVNHFKECKVTIWDDWTENKWEADAEYEGDFSYNDEDETMIIVDVEGKVEVEQW